MIKVVLSKSDTIGSTLQQGIAQLGDIKEIIPEKAQIMILVDINVPEGNPATINPETLGKLIEICKIAGSDRVVIALATNTGFKQQKIGQYLGLDDYVHSFGAEFWYFAEDTNFTTELAKFSYRIILHQVKSHPFWQITTATTSLAYISPYSTRWNANQNPSLQGENPSIPEKSKCFYEKWVIASQQNLMTFKPNLVINDVFFIMEGNGPLIQQSSITKKTQMMVISTDLHACDLVTFHLFGLQKAEAPFLKISELKSIENLEIVNSNLLSTPLSLKLPEADPFILAKSIRGLKLILGEVNMETKLALLEFLHSLKSLLFKDAMNLGEWYILAGDKPGTTPESIPSSGKIVLFGDAAIKSTENYPFRTIIKKKDILSEDQFQNEMLRQEHQARESGDKLRNAYQTLSAEIDTKDDPLDREESHLHEEKKLELMVAKLFYKQKNKTLKFRHKQEKNKLLNLAPKMELNKAIMELPNTIDSGWNALIPFYYFWNNHQVPLLGMQIEVLRNCSTLVQFDVKAMKNQWKAKETAFQKQLKATNLEIVKDMKAKLQNLKTEIKSQSKIISAEYKTQQQNIRNQFKPKETELKAKFKAAKDKAKQEKQQKKSALKMTLKTESINKPDSTNNLSDKSESELTQGEKHE